MFWRHLTKYQAVRLARKNASGSDQHTPHGPRHLKAVWAGIKRGKTCVEETPSRTYTPFSFRFSARTCWMPSSLGRRAVPYFRSLLKQVRYISWGKARFHSMQTWSISRKKYNSKQCRNKSFQRGKLDSIRSYNSTHATLFPVEPRCLRLYPS